ncbi:hypothetical protein BAC3_01481 [uncultured bacterium]|nr:hypothetical protein BAC3_01481 [uncultured bacterium]
MKRKKFFILAGTALAGLMSFRIYPFQRTQQETTKQKKVSVRINPLAVHRKSGGSK